MKKYDLAEALRAIDPSAVSYEEWIEAGMALKEEGYPLSLWDDWSGKDTARYHEGECERKWNGFYRVGVTGGTLVKLAFDHGWTPAIDPADDYELEWDNVIIKDNPVIDAAWVEDADVAAPGAGWDPVKDLITYLDTLFDSEDNVGYVTNSFVKDGKHLPLKGAWDRTAGELIAKLGACGGDIGSVLGDYNPEVGAWIRFNPFDGQGIKNSNVTEFRYALVESDTLSIEKQNALVRELELPVAALVHSGGKSLHAIVRIDAKDYDEYRKRVDYLYAACKKNGIEVDGQNKNPSRLSRLPGVMRNGERQYLVATNIGRASWDDWKAWYEEAQDAFPDISTLEEEFSIELENVPDVISGVLSEGDKMMIAGPSKAGKSFALMGLAISVATGGRWMGWWCRKGTVLYINLEIKKADRIRRMKKICETLDIKEGDAVAGIYNLDLKGYAAAIDTLENKIIRTCSKIHPSLIIIDPIYKVMLGDENSAADVSKFCNSLDRLCSQIGAAIVYCHHHSKGSQGAKASIDRASGSGVFARDVDALLDFTELHVTDAMRSALDGDEYMTAWILDATVREFAKPKPKHVLFRHPVHVVDETKTCEDAVTEAEWNIVQNRKSARKEQADKAEVERIGQIEAFREGLAQAKDDGSVPDRKYMAEFLSGYFDMEISERTVTNWVNKFKKNGDANFKADRKEDNGYIEIPF